jgi:hypothetical protein
VNEVLKHAGIDILGPINPLFVPILKADLKAGRGIEISQAEAKPGDITLVDNGNYTQHIGICMSNGCTQVLSNSSSNASFTYFDIPGFPKVPAYRVLKPEFYRVTQKERLE